MPVIFNNDRFPFDVMEYVAPNRENGVSPIVEHGIRLAHGLQRAGWDVPGVKVVFEASMRDGRIMRHLKSVSGMTSEGPFNLSYSNFGDRSVLAFVTVPPGVKASFSEGMSPTVVLFLTNDWAADGQRCMAMSTRDARKEGRPKEYLRYEGDETLERRYRGLHEKPLTQRILLKASTDENEHRPEADAPASLTHDEMMGRLTPFLDRLIDRVEKLPAAPGHDDVAIDGDANLRRLSAIEEHKAPQDIPVLYTWMEEDHAYGWMHADDEDRKTKEVISGNGTRLAFMGAKGERTLHPRATDGFSYACENPRQAYHHRSGGPKENALPVRVVLKDVTEIYVVDNAAFKDRRAQMSVIAEAEGRDEFTTEETALLEAAVAETMTPLKDYIGGFKKPCYAIGRRLMQDEATLMRGPIALVEKEDGIRVSMTDDASGDEVVLFENERVIPYTRRQAVLVAERAAVTLFGRRDAYESRLMAPPEPEPDIMEFLNAAREARP